MQKNTASMQKIFEAWQKLTFCRVDKKGSVHTTQKETDIKNIYYLPGKCGHSSLHSSFSQSIMHENWRLNKNWNIKENKKNLGGRLGCTS